MKVSYMFRIKEVKYKLLVHTFITIFQMWLHRIKKILDQFNILKNHMQI